MRRRIAFCLGNYNGPTSKNSHREHLFTIAAGGADIADMASVEPHELDSEERAALANEPNVLQAPAMAFTRSESFSATAAGSIPPDLNWGLEMIGAEVLSDTAGSGAKVAVLDTGIDAHHPAFEGITIEQANFTTEPDHDIDGHGTHCRSTDCF